MKRLKNTLQDDGKVSDEEKSVIKTSAAPDKEPLSGDTNANDHNNKDVSELPK